MVHSRDYRQAVSVNQVYRPAAAIVEQEVAEEAENKTCAFLRVLCYLLFKTPSFQSRSNMRSFAHDLRRLHTGGEFG